MIIIETKTGPHMINERETIGCSFDKANGEAIVTYNRDPREVVSFHEGTPTSRTEYPSVTFTDVEDVIYVTDQNTGSYHYNGSEIERLKAELEKEKKKYIQLCEHSSYVREWYMIYEDAIISIKDQQKQAERENKGIYVSPLAIIEAAEKKHKESEEKFETARKKLEK